MTFRTGVCMWTGWLIGILGIWMVIVPFLSLPPLSNAWIMWIIGAVVAILGFIMTSRRPWQGWLAGIVGIWLFISGFFYVLRFSPGVWWNDIIVGLTFIIAGFSAVSARGPVVPPPAV